MIPCLWVLWSPTYPFKNLCLNLRQHVYFLLAVPCYSLYVNINSNLALKTFINTKTVTGCNSFPSSHEGRISAANWMNCLPSSYHPKDEADPTFVNKDNSLSLQDNQVSLWYVFLSAQVGQCRQWSKLKL